MSVETGLNRSRAAASGVQGERSPTAPPDQWCEGVTAGSTIARAVQAGEAWRQGPASIASRRRQQNECGRRRRTKKRGDGGKREKSAHRNRRKTVESKDLFARFWMFECSTELLARATQSRRQTPPPHASDCSSRCWRTFCFAV